MFVTSDLQSIVYIKGTAIVCSPRVILYMILARIPHKCRVYKSVLHHIFK
jgi:hypothetical protein